MKTFLYRTKDNRHDFKFALEPKGSRYRLRVLSIPPALTLTGNQLFQATNCGSPYERYELKTEDGGVIFDSKIPYESKEEAMKGAAFFAEEQKKIWEKENLCARNDKDLKRGHSSPSLRFHEKNNPFEVLGVAPDATPKDIKRAFRQKMALHHPDTVSEQCSKAQESALRKSQEINAAYSTLKPQRRA